MAAKKLKRPKVGSFELSAFFAVKDLRFCSVLSVNSVLKDPIPIAGVFNTEDAENTET